MKNMAHFYAKNPAPTPCFTERIPYYRPQQSFKRHHHFMGNPNNMFPTVDENLIQRQVNSMGKHVYDTEDHLKHNLIYGMHSTASFNMAESSENYPSSYGTPSEDLEAFAERFKQRRIKLGVTQADVGRALVHLQLPGVGTLSQSTICRFESLTLSRNNMVALKPILQSWLEAAELQGAKKVLPDKKRKRTSIAALERRSLEAYFAVQQRPSSDKITSIAQKLDLKKSVVRVWFCNQRQKQKRMKYSACLNS